MARMGMDADAVESAGRALKERAGQIDAIVSNLDRSVKGLLSVWDGPDAQTFVHKWWPEHRALLVTARGHVDGLGQSALNNASEQRGVSGVKGDHGSTSPNSGGGGDTPPTHQAPGPAIGSQSIGSISPPPSQEAYNNRVGDGSDLAPGKENDGQCTSWVNFRRDQLGLQVPHGNGAQTAGSLPNHGPDPSLGAVGSFSESTWGHTFIVEGITSTDPPTISVSQMNVGAIPDKVNNPSITTGWHTVSADTWTLVDKSTNTWHSNISGNRVLTFGQ